MTNGNGCTKIFTTELGKIAISATAQGLTELTFLVGSDSRLEFQHDPVALPHVTKAGQWLKDFLKGSTQSYEGPLVLEGTEFQKSVWRQIESIEYGKTLSYGEIAHRIGKPLAARAVGAAVGANPIPLIVPCHRVMGSTGRITGYSGGDGIPTKRKLLALEKIGYTE